MKTEILKSFSSLGCDCQLSCITFEHSRQEVFQVSVRFLVAPKDWSSNYQVLTFSNDEESAKKCFTDFVRDFI